MPEYATQPCRRSNSARFPENNNFVGDGKLDQAYLPSDVEVPVGRVDFSRLELAGAVVGDGAAAAIPGPQPRVAARADRRAAAPRAGRQPPRALELGVENGWRSFAPLVGSSNITSRDWLTHAVHRRATSGPTAPGPATSGRRAASRGPGDYNHNQPYHGRLPDALRHVVRRLGQAQRAAARGAVEQRPGAGRHLGRVPELVPAPAGAGRAVRRSILPDPEPARERRVSARRHRDARACTSRSWATRRCARMLSAAVTSLQAQLDRRTQRRVADTGRRAGRDGILRLPRRVTPTGLTSC